MAVLICAICTWPEPLPHLLDHPLRVAAEAVEVLIACKRHVYMYSIV